MPQLTPLSATDMIANTGPQRPRLTTGNEVNQMHPYLSIQVGSERRREMLANAEQQRLARQLRALRPGIPPRGPGRAAHAPRCPQPLRPRTELEP